MHKLAVILSGFAVLATISMLVLFFNIEKNLALQNAKLNAKIEQQSMLINRALGNVIPLVLPPDVEDKILALERRLADESKWPKDTAEVQKQITELTDLVTNLPPWAQEELLPRLLPRMWELDALEILANATGVLEKDLTMNAKADTLLMQKPLTASVKIADKLNAWQTQVENLIVKAERSAALARAEEALNGNGDMEDAALSLTSYHDSQAKELAAKLDREMIKLWVSHQINFIQADLNKSSDFEPAIIEYAFHRTSQRILDVKLRMASVDISDTAIENRLNILDQMVQQRLAEITEIQQKKVAEKLRNYQIWALEQIKKVRQYNNVHTLEEEQIQSMLDRKNPLSGESKNAARRASLAVGGELLHFMAPISQGLLDEPVNQLFRKVYQSRFERLHEDDQFEVIKGFAMAEKRPLE